VNAFARRDWSDGVKLVVLDTPAFREDTWYRRNGNERVAHWAYAADAFLRTRDRHEIEWTPGVPRLRARQIGARALAVRLQSATPGFQEYWVRIDESPWQPCLDGNVVWNLDRPLNRLQVRVRNRFAVEGPPVSVEVQTR
jgi:hypothetical protein